ncbi:glycosyltransferase [Exiguobacterium sp. RIT341]|uniref:glycosyltransferase n=1 Tax=Exiguobacterium sp. RIT341 TaxID=1470592 RepID=UPI00044C38AC|nr:glycosyltransferase [Exiguobacterium sp. RIT341]EZP59693.1 N-acetyl-alpha-D-glucosaminyl L-malate synthase BshA [Exiguobacterium sp. RIT341]
MRNKKIVFFSTSELFGNRKTGGLKRFLELYKYYKCKSSVDTLLYTGDPQKVLSKEIKENFISLDRRTNKHYLVPNEILIFISNFKEILKLKNSEYDELIVFDVPTAISLSLLNLKNINLFIRQDLIGYKKIYLSDKKTSNLSKKIYINLLKFAETICIIKSKKIFVQCEYDLNELIKRHKYLKKMIKNKTIVQINNINPSWVTTSGYSTSYRKNESIKKIGFIGDFSNERKGHKLFLESMSKIKNKKIEVTVIGDGIKLDLYKEKFADERITFTGRVENVSKYLNQFDLLVVPSIADSCPNTVLEALYNNVLVIGSNAGGIPEILNYKEAIFNLDEKSLVHKINELEKNENIETLSKLQMIRKKDLLFNWPEKINDFIEE